MVGRRFLGTAEGVAEAVVDAGLKGKAERYTPRIYGVAAAVRFVAPGLLRRIMGSDRAKVMTTTTASDTPAAEDAA